jgi:vacuolar-type H+-ATPase subunit C/Vma6
MKTTLPADAGTHALGDVPGEFLYAKLRGRRSRLLEGERLRDLAREPSLRDLASRLYPRERVDERAEMERLVLSRCVAELHRLGRYVSGARAAFFHRLLERYPVESLKVLLRLHGSQEDAAPYLMDLPDDLALPVERLAACPDVEAFVEAVPLPYVRQCALDALGVHAETGNRAYLEMAFDKGYWQAVWDGLGGLSGPDARQCAAPVRAEFRAMQLLATLRAASVYDLSWEQWAPVLPNGPDGLSRAVLRDVHAHPELDYAVERLAVPGLTPDGGAAEDIGTLEEALWRRAVHAADRQFYASSSAVALLVSYFYLKRHEMRHLLGLAQMLRYGESPDRIVDYLGLE